MKKPPQHIVNTWSLSICGGARLVRSTVAVFLNPPWVLRLKELAKSFWSVPTHENVILVGTGSKLLSQCKKQIDINDIGMRRGTTALHIEPSKQTNLLCYVAITLKIKALWHGLILPKALRMSTPQPGCVRAEVWNDHFAEHPENKSWLNFIANRLAEKLRRQSGATRNIDLFIRKLLGGGHRH